MQKASHLYPLINKVPRNSDSDKRRRIKSTFKNKKMNFKKFLRIASVVTLMAITLPVSSAIVVPESTPTNNTTVPENPAVQQMLQRLEYIKGLDKSEMTRLEKKNLRKEVRDIKKEMKVASGGVYLSVGAIIIVILLLILLL